MVLTVLVNMLIWFGFSAPRLSWADANAIIVDVPKHFDCRVQNDQSHLDLFYSGDPSGLSRILFSDRYYFSSTLEEDYLSCHRILALAEAYKVNVSADPATGQLKLQLDGNQNPNVLPAKPEMLKCEVNPEGSYRPNAITIFYGDHVIYRDVSLIGFNDWITWLNNCNSAKGQARAKGGVVLINLITWEFTAATL